MSVDIAELRMACWIFGTSSSMEEIDAAISMVMDNAPELLDELEALRKQTERPPDEIEKRRESAKRTGLVSMVRGGEKSTHVDNPYRSSMEWD